MISLLYMRAFYEADPDEAIVQQIAAQITWFHNCRSILVHKIESGLYERQGRVLVNFERTLPAPQSELARQILKDPYNFDFLTLGKEAQERDLEAALLSHLQEFLLEMGVGRCEGRREMSRPIRWMLSLTRETDTMNETLEALARTFFKSWFIDDDHVRARAEGRAPAGMDAETAAMFADGVEETERGMMARGWKVATIGDLVKVVGGSTLSTENPEFWGGSMNFATPKYLASLTAPILRETERRITDAGLEKTSSRFASKVEALIDMIVLNLSQSIAIIIIRDMILPKLLSGEIRTNNQGNVYK